MLSAAVIMTKSVLINLKLLQIINIFNVTIDNERFFEKLQDTNYKNN